MKLYNNKEISINNNKKFIRKFRIFENNCQYVDIQVEDYPKAFPIMLLELAVDFYYNDFNDKL